MSITVHHLNNSRSQRVLWLLEELGLPYEVKRYERDAATRLAPPELKAIHPLGKSPVVEADGAVLAETGAVVETLLDGYGQGRLKPAGGAELARWRFWMHYAEGSAMPPLLLRLVLGTIEARAPLLVRPIARGIVRTARARFVDPQLKLHMDYWEAELGRADHFAGAEFSAADVMMSFPVEAGAARAGALEGRPKLAAWLARMHARPAYQRALERGGPYTILR